MSHPNVRSESFLYCMKPLISFPNFHFYSQISTTIVSSSLVLRQVCLYQNDLEILEARCFEVDSFFIHSKYILILPPCAYEKTSPILATDEFTIVIGSMHAHLYYLANYTKPFLLTIFANVGIHYSD